MDDPEFVRGIDVMTGEKRLFRQTLQGLEAVGERTGMFPIIDQGSAWHAVRKAQNARAHMLITERELFRVIARAEPFINGKVSAPEPLYPGLNERRALIKRIVAGDITTVAEIVRDYGMAEHNASAMFAAYKPKPYSTRADIAPGSLRVDSFSTGDGIVVALIFGLLIFCLLVH